MKKEIEFLKDVVLKANNISKKPFVTKTKDAESDLVTNLDLEIEKFLIQEINREFPDFDIVSEEYNTNNKITSNCFIIDPIDGTINFSNNLPLWGIQIACVKDGHTIASVISLPRINELYYADETGAYLNDKKIQVNEVPIKNTLYAIDGSNNLPCMQRMRKYSSNRRNFGGVCISMAFMASGRIHGAVFRSDKPWDYEPGLFICKMAGASVRSINGFHAAAMNEEFLNILEFETAKKQNVSNIFIFHSLKGDTLTTWGKDIKEEFGQKEIDVILPEFPIKENSSYEEFKNILKYYYENRSLNSNSIVIAHSISNAYFIRFCQELDFIPKAYIAVAPHFVYNTSLNGYDYMIDVIKQAYLKNAHLYFAKINLKNKYCLYSENSICNIEEYTRFIKDIDAVDVYLKNYNCFDSGHNIYKIPELIKLIDNLL